MVKMSKDLEDRYRVRDEAQKSSIPPHDNSGIELSQGSLNIYHSKGYPYYRFSYWEGGKKRHIHLCSAKPVPLGKQELLRGIRTRLAQNYPLEKILDYISYTR